jgi:sulfoxide reductase heme-binding subunit YedZ
MSLGGRAVSVEAWETSALFVVALLPLLRLFALALDGGLGANPVEFVTHSTGTWALVFLLFTLAATPVRRLAGSSWLLRHRRMLGLFSFFYASLHLATYVWWDQFFDWVEILRDVAKRPFVALGFAAYGLMLPLAVTSSRAMMRRLGRHWQRLHRLVYLVAVLAVLHYAWLVKRDLTLPTLYAVVLCLLLAARLPLAAKKKRVGKPPA